MLRIGMLLAERYEILQQIGSGGMAYVYRAKDHKLNRYVAIKVLKEEFCRDKAFVSKFRMEAQAAAGLSHTNIVGVYDVGEINSIYFIVMELIEGITLKEYITRKRKLGIKESIGVAIQVAQGLAAAHSRHLIHRDIKPQNIIISRDGKIKVADFGIARAITDETTNMYKAAGSVHYISPEQARGGYCDERSDIYSLGITMYEMVTGRVPFDGDTTVAVAIAHMNEAIIPPSQFEPSVPLALEQIIFKCVQKKPERRYGSCEELIADLRQAIVTPQKGFVQFASVDEDDSTTIMSEAEVEAIRNQDGQGPTQDTIQITPLPARGKPRYIQDDDYAEAVDFSNPASRKENEPAVRPERPLGRQQAPRERYPSKGQERPVKRERPVRPPERNTPPKRETVKNDEPTWFDRILLGIGTTFGIVILLMVIYIAVSLNGLFSAERSGETLPQQTIMTTAEETEEETVTVWEPSEGDTMSEDMAEVPDVLGCSIQEAKELLEDVELVMKVSNKYEHSDDYAAGLICKQQYKAGSVIEKGTKVTVTISVGSDKFHLVGDQYIYGSLSLLQYALNSYDIDYELIGTESETYQKNTILALEPKDGDLAPGDTLKIYYSTGPSKVAVPELYGKSKEQAVSALENVGLYLGAVSEQYSDSVDAGVICGQSIGSGTTVKIGSSIDVVISLGKKTYEVPNVLWYPEQDAITALANRNLSYETVRVYDDNNPSGTVINQSISAGSWVPEWTTVTLTISLGPEPLTVDTNVAGQTYDEVQAALNAIGVSGTPVYEESSSVEAGRVIRLVLPNDGQGPVYRGSSVTVVISSGPPVTEPPVQTEPVQTEPAAPPVTEAPPATEPVIEEPPATEAPVNEAPVE